MTNDNQSTQVSLSRRKILAGIGTIGAAGAGAGLGTSAFFSDQEVWANNQLVAGKLDLKVGWEVRYFDWIDSTPQVISESGLTDDPGPLVQLEDVKPGDVITHTLNARIVGNPAFLSLDCSLQEDSDNGTTDPEDAVHDPPSDGFDGTPGGDLGEALRMVVWFDDGDGLPQEIWAADDFPQTEEDFIMAVGDADRPSDIFDLQSPNLAAAGTALDLCFRPPRLLDPRVNDHVANNFPNSLCYQSSETESIGVLIWVPTDIPGVDDNIIQTDRCEYRLGFNGIQCRHNVANNGRPKTKQDNQPKHLLIYRVNPTPPNTKRDGVLEEKKDVSFRDQFGNHSGSIQAITWLAEPVSKGFDEKNPSFPPKPGKPPSVLPLTGYGLSGGDNPDKFVKVKDQFTTHGTRLEKQKRLFDPTTVKVTPPVTPPGEAPEEKNTQFPTPLVFYKYTGSDPVANATTKDQFTVFRPDSEFREFSIGPLEFLVDPITKNEESSSNTDSDPFPYTCYKVTPEDDAKNVLDLNVRVKDQFFTSEFAEISVRGPTHLCTRAVKKEVLPLESDEKS